MRPIEDAASCALLHRFPLLQVTKFATGVQQGENVQPQGGTVLSLWGEGPSQRHSSNAATLDGSRPQRYRVAAPMGGGGAAAKLQHASSDRERRLTLSSALARQQLANADANNQAHSGLKK